MRLLFVSHSFPPPGRPLDNVGGMQRVAVEQYAALRAHPGVEVSGLLLQTSWRMTHLRTPAFLLSLLREIPRRVRAERIDAVLFSSMVTAATAPLLRRRLPSPPPVLAALAMGRDVTLPAAPYQRLLPRVFNALDRVLPISRATGEECLRRGARPAAVEVVGLGADFGRFPPVADRGAARERLLHRLGERFPPEALLLCSVGRHQERKGFHWFIDQVMPTLPPDVAYLLAGAGPLTESIRAAVAARGLEARVRVLGKVDEETLTALYQGSDLFVMPNIPVAGDMEGFGVVMLEAGLGGLPVVAAALEGIRDVVREGENGHLVASRDAAAFRAAILRYHADRAALARAAAAARAYTEATFSWRGVADAYLRVLGGARSGSR